MPNKHILSNIMYIQYSWSKECWSRECCVVFCCLKLKRYPESVFNGLFESEYILKFFPLFLCRWEDNLENAGTANQPRGSVFPSYTRPTSNTVGYVGRGRGRNQGRQRGQRGGQTINSTFVNATGEPLSGRRCFACGDPAHFANVCPNRGVWLLTIFLRSCICPDT